MSLLDDFAEYESGANQQQQLVPSEFGSDDVAVDPMTTDGYVTTTLEDAPIFSLDKVQFQVPNQVIAMAVANDMLVLVIEGARIMRIDLQEAHNIREFEIPVKPTDLKACSAFLDPTGRHLLISTPQGENFYHFEDWEAAKPLSRFKSMEVTAVAWNHMATANSDSTKRIILGTHDGRIYETELRPGNDAKAKRSEIALKMAGNVPVRERITGIAMVPFPKRTKQNLVLVSTGTRLYQLIGAADTAASSDKVCAFESLFTEGFANPNFQEIPGMPGPGSLAVYHDGTTATDFAWLTSMGVFFGKLVFGSQESGDSVIENASLLPYPVSSGSEQPLSLALAEFHILLQYSNQIRALNMLNCKPAYDQPVNDNLQGMVVDSTNKTYWLFSPNDIYEIVVTDEDRDVWEIFLARRQFDNALSRCHNDAQRDQVWRAQADHLFKMEEYVGAAECYAKSSISFEEAVLKFIGKKQNTALKSYLLSKLDTLRRQDQTQTTLLVMWLIDIYLGMLSAADAKLTAARANAGANSVLQEQQAVVSEFEREHAAAQDELHALVERYKNAVDAHTTYQLAESHGQREFWLHYASLRGDYERVVEYWMEKEEFMRALQVLGHYGTPEMLYRYSPVLMSAQPEALVDILMRQPNLTPSKLIPALMKYKPERSGPTNQALRYLHFCTQRQMCRDPTVYNYYLTLLVHESTSSDESELMAFLTTYGKDMLYDPDYALRMCKRFGRIQSCVHLYSLLKLHEDAVDLALEHGDIELAQIHAERPEGDDKLCKRLWLKIAQHVIKTNTSAADVMELVHRSNRLGVEDILPFFPDFTRVDDFKEDICTALEDYETQIQDLRSEMDESTRTAENMQRNMQGLKHRFAILNAEEACQLCDQPLWMRQFYAFPCQHAFHADCLTRKIVGTCNRVQRRRIHELQSQSVEIMKQRRQLRLAPLTGKQTGESDEALDAQSRRVRKQLDTLVAGECVLCGEVMIKSVAEPFVTSDQAADESWVI